MSTFVTTTPRSNTGIGLNVFTLFGNGFTAVADWNDARVTRNSLSRLTARELDDIGLCYGDIEQIAVKGVTR